MQEFDKLPNNIIVLAATNRLDILDDAFISRFSIKRKINSFTEEQNKKMIHLFSENEINTIIGSTHSQKEIINPLSSRPKSRRINLREVNASARLC